LPPENRRADGTVYESGTVWELDDARSAGRDVWIYRCCEAPKVALNDPEKTQKEEQYRCLEAFVAGSRAPDGSLRFGVHEFLHDQQFSGLVREHLRQFVRQVAPSTVPTPKPAVIASVVGIEPQVSAADLADRLDRLIQLCDREDVSDLFTAKMRQRVKLAKPGGGLLCILPGGVNLRHIKASESRRNVASRSGCFSGFGRVGFTPFSVFLQRGKWRPEGCPGDRGINAGCLAFMPRKPLDTLEVADADGSCRGCFFIPGGCLTASAGSGAAPQGLLAAEGLTCGRGRLGSVPARRGLDGRPDFRQGPRFAPGLAVENDLISTVAQTVERRRPHQLVGKRRAPLVEVQIRHYGAATPSG
jgi:hypothetical protein